MTASMLTELSRVARLDARAADRLGDDETAEYLHELADTLEGEAALVAYEAAEILADG